MTVPSDLPADWTLGAPGIVYQRCRACDQVWYFRRGFCPACGEDDPQALPATGNGTVHATTLVHRAPSDEFRALAPYRIVLVDCDEGFRMMAHGHHDLAIGDRVHCRFEPMGHRLLPFFERAKQ